MTDAGQVLTEKFLDKLENRIKDVYSQAQKELSEKINNASDAAKRNLQSLSDNLANDMTNANRMAADLINGNTPEVYALNHNYGTYQIESGLNISTSYSLYNRDTVAMLLRDAPKLLPKAKIDIPLDQRWNRNKMRSALLQSTLQGESIKQTAKRLQSVTSMNYRSAVRNARTMTTGIQNRARQRSYFRAMDMGLDVSQVWVATLDNRTRHSHIDLDGEKRKPGKKFSNGCLFPGDPDGRAEEVYNCRCTLIPDFEDVHFDVSDLSLRKHHKLGNGSYRTWKDKGSKISYEKQENVDFAAWLKKQAAPASVIQKFCMKNKFNDVYRDIRSKKGSDANEFYNELEKMGRPMEVWDKYLTGQLDADELKEFEKILKKYLPELR